MDQRVREIAERARRVDPGAVRVFLDGACGNDAALRAGVERMLEQEKHQTADTATGAERVNGEQRGAVATVVGGAGDVVGASIGPYKVLQLIGEGGFGIVYMAQQSQPVRRKVALKIIKPGMDSRQVIGRFEAERQALAMMDHPNIARVLDAGTTPEGRPYFVMELVKGVPITEYCDTANQTTEERLALFSAVCHAVQHAHQKGIIHRDLKPSNVLVTLHDDVPVVKVIDFGIAKAMNQDLTERTVFTEFRQFVGTPEYMSPEQAAMSGLDVDTRADIYSLGVLLYELLTGTTPFDPEKLRSAGMAEIQRMIKEDEPPRPSTRISKGLTRRAATSGGATAIKVGTTAAMEIARHRRTDVKSLCRLLAGDLDWIVMKAMEKDRTRRYPSAGAFAEDIRRYLADEPVMARAPTAAYRFRKFARRNRALIGAGGGVLMALLLALVALSYGLLQARYERNQTAMRETMTRANMLLSTMNSVRKYTTANVRPALQKKYGAEFVREMVPGFSAKTVFEKFREDPTYKDFLYKEAAPNPTNRANLADEFERGLVDQFKADPNAKELSGRRVVNGVENYYIARPMRIADQSCLDCHTTPDKAPPEQVAMYGSDTGFGWKMGEMIATQVVYVPVSEAVKTDPQQWVRVLGGLAGVFVAGGVGSLLWLRRA